MFQKLTFIKREKKDSSNSNNSGISGGISGLANINNINQLPSFERFKDLLTKLENEYKLLWIENQELKLKCESLSNNSNNNNSVINIENNNIENQNNNNNSSKVNEIPIIPASQPQPQIIQQPQPPPIVLPPTSNSNNSSGNVNSLNNSNGILMSATGKNKLPKIKKLKSQSSSSSSKQSSSSSSSKNNVSKRDGSHKWIRAKEYLGHRDGIWEITASPWDLLYFGTASIDKTARIWSVDDSKLPIIYTAHTGTVNSIRFHPIERFFLTSSGDKTIHVVKLPTERGSSSHNNSNSSSLKSPSQQHKNKQPIHLQPSSPNLFRTNQTSSNSPVLGRSSNVLVNNITNVSASTNNQLKNKLWTPLLDRSIPPPQQQPPQPQPITLKQAPSFPNSIIIQQQQQRQQQLQKNLNDDDYLDSDTDSDLEQDLQLPPQQPIVQTFKGALLPPQSPREIKIINEHQPLPPPQQQQQIQQPLPSPQQSIQQQQQTVKKSSSSNTHHNNNNNNNYQQPTCTYLRTPMLEFKGHSGPVIGATWLSSNIVASGSWDNSIRWWNAENGKLISSNSICSDRIHRITNITSNPLCNTNSITSSTDGIIRVWDYRSSNVTDSIQHNASSNQDQPINSAVFTSDGVHIVSGGEDRFVKVWDVRQSKTYKTSIRCPFSINRLSISSSTNTIAIPQDDGRISVYDIHGNRKGKMRDQYKYGHKQMATSTSWSHDDSVIFSTGFDRKSISWANSS